MRFKKVAEGGGAAAQPSLIISDKAGKEEVVALRDKTHRTITQLLMQKFHLHWGMLPYKSAILGG